jgi:hypothetical protein
MQSQQKRSQKPDHQKPPLYTTSVAKVLGSYAKCFFGLQVVAYVYFPLVLLK